MTDLDKLRSIRFWSNYLTAFLLGMTIGINFILEDDYGNLVWVVPLAGAIVCNAIGLITTKMIDNMELLETMTWESERALVQLQMRCATKWTQCASRAKPRLSCSFRRRSAKRTTSRWKNAAAFAKRIRNTHWESSCRNS